MIYALDVARAENLFGKLDDCCRARLEAVIADPTEQTWDEAHSLIVSLQRPSLIGTTLWQAVIAVDPSFPHRGPNVDGQGHRIGSWARVPDRDVLLRALRWAVSEEPDGS